jgi:uroporphyrinogen decarboxylase
MENLMTDMMTDDPIAEALFDRVTDIAVKRATSYVKNGVDVLFLGDDIGMQKTIMMSENLYCEWLKPRLKKVIDEARKINPDVVVFYHSCGFVTPMIPHLIEAGIDVLNPVQPECMDFRKIHEMYGDRLSFNGTVGTQTTMPFGTPDEVRKEVFKNLDIAGDKGGLLVAPTHMLEPKVPLENLIAYIKACKEYK